jgi:beta-aspartyl-peptidase (threonine type)
MKRSRATSLIVHGGAWNIPDDLTDAHRKGVLKALVLGWDVLQGRGSAVEAVEVAISAMEDDETFDAGRGSFLNEAGEVELDASIMNGKTFRAGAVAAVQNIAHPISLARAIMEKSGNVLLVGMGAVRFAKDHRIPTCGQDDLIIEREIRRWRESHAGEGKNPSRRGNWTRGDTVGAVALDAAGNIAAGTSTGGTPNKHPGRVGDSALIGCGTYADNALGGASATGWGEAIIPVVLAKSVVDGLVDDGRHPDNAAAQGITLLKRKTSGYGGVIVLNRNGEVGVAFNTPRMARAYMTSGMKSPVAAV